MDTKLTKGENKKSFLNRCFGWGSLLWWRVNPEELKEQVENYSTLKITQSAKGISFLFLIASGIITLSFVAFFSYGKTGIFDTVLFVIFGFFVYKGQRWAIIGAMVLWTIGKFLLAYEAIIGSGSNKGIAFILQIAWWALYMHAFYVALKVETLRCKKTN